MIRTFILALLFLIVSFGARAQTYEIVGDDDFAPFSFIDENNQVSGIDIDILRELSDRLDIEFDIELVPWKRLLLMTKTGSVFGSFSLFQTAEREEYSLFTYPLHYSTFKLFTLTDKVFKYESVEDLYGKRIAIAAGFSLSEAFELARANDHIKVIEIFSFKDGFRRLLRGGIDAFVGNDLVFEYQLKQSISEMPELTLVESLSKPLQLERGAFFVLSKRYPLREQKEWQRKITQELQAMEREGFLESTIKRYVH